LPSEARKSRSPQSDPRLTWSTVLAPDPVGQLLGDQDAVEPGFAGAAYFEPAPLLDVMEDRPELFEDLPPIPDGAELTGSDVTYDRAAAEQACAWPQPRPPPPRGSAGPASGPGRPAWPPHSGSSSRSFSCARSGARRTP